MSSSELTAGRHSRSPGDAGFNIQTPRVPTFLSLSLRKLRQFGFVSLLILAWQYISGVWLPAVDATLVTLLPPPSAVALAARDLIVSGELPAHLWASLQRELIAFAFALAAIPLGIAMGWWKWVNEQIDPLIETLRPIPPIAWIPLSILWFGIGDAQNQFIIFLGIFFPILINTVTGVKGIETNLIRAAQSLGASQWHILTRVVLRAALPQILTGIRVGFGFGWMALVAAELVGASSGLGFLINDARSVLRTDIILVGMLTIGFTGFLIDTLVRKLARRLLPWSLAATR
ncbi:ABC transporter permease [Rhodocyclus tenuis]|uniref:ABC-type nitrate/sulfonate/bicarbonate transport system permease component n=1 Tax=Rhodocyclus tenuis TaxID=1066 RepID=A0A840GAV8_RHOTE|nr:ABC transporter permease [Rhodocyclus tenuis]MBB4248611.1 ABC-type nitrate/sulfonate/bicarbonate transport system permease component [Rhodocyclus tenuis]